jgi:hypothetical protein
MKREKTGSGLEYQDIVVGKGQQPVKGFQARTALLHSFPCRSASWEAKLS